MTPDAPLLGRPAPRMPLPPPTHLGGHWPEILWDLGCLGELRVETESSALTIAHRTELTAVRVHRDLAFGSGTNFALRILLERCYAIVGETAADDTAPGALHIEDALRRPLLTLRAPADRPGSRRPLGWLLGAHGGRGRRIVPARDEPARAFRLCDASAHPAARLGDRCDGPQDGIALSDMVELAGLAAMDRFRLRKRGRLVGVDPARVGAALGTFADRRAPLRLVGGNDGVVRSLHFIPDRAKLALGSLDLAGEGVDLRLDTAAIASAWVVQPAVDQSAVDQSVGELRLYDADHRAIACFAPITDAGIRASTGVPPVWRALLDALTD